MKMRYPMATPTISKTEINYVLSAIKSTWVSSTGTYIQEFETEFARFIGTTYAISTNNGTSALHLALLALGIGKGDEVILPALTFVSSANAISYTGAKPVFVDVDPLTWNIDPQKIAKKITARTKAVMPVHLYGYPARMDIIKKIAKKFSLSIIEDAAEAHGAKFANSMVGNCGDIGCFSFYGNKIITTGEGGMITTNNKKLKEKIELLKNHGMSPTKKYWHPEIGFNYRLTNPQAALGLAQLKKIPQFLKQRAYIDTLYRRYLEKIPQVVFPPQNSDKVTRVNWLFTILIKNSSRKSRDELISYLKTKGIDSRPTFFSVPLFPMYLEKYPYPQTRRISETGITLPTYIGLTSKDIAYICQSIARYFLP